MQLYSRARDTRYDLPRKLRQPRLLRVGRHFPTFCRRTDPRIGRSNRINVAGTVSASLAVRERREASLESSRRIGNAGDKRGTVASGRKGGPRRKVILPRRNLSMQTIKTRLERGEFQGPSSERLIRGVLFIARSCAAESRLFAPLWPFHRLRIIPLPSSSNLATLLHFYRRPNVPNRG